MMFSFPGPHNYPPVAKRHSFNWFDRWLGHVPAVPTIWPGVAGASVATNTASMSGVFPLPPAQRH